jgi:hypothetical protein
MHSRLTDDVVASIKLARKLGYKYEVIAAHYVINQGRIADVMKGRIAPSVRPANDLPTDFPKLD